MDTIQFIHQQQLYSMKNLYRFLPRYFFILILWTLVYLPGYALRIEYGNTVVISQATYENLYIAGGTLTINAPVHGDLVIVGGTVIINDSILGDILIGGGNLTLNGFVSGDLRGMGGEIHLSKNVDGDVLLAGGTLDVEKNVIIGNLIAAGGKVTLHGMVTKDVKMAAGEFILNGKIGGIMDFRGDKITVNGEVGGPSSIAASTAIQIRESAIFRSDVRYWVPGVAPVFGSSLANTKAVMDPTLQINEKRWYYLGWGSILFLIWYMGMALLMIIAIQYFFPVTMHQAAITGSNDTLKAFFRGLLFLLLMPLAILVLFVTVIGIPIAVILLFAYIALIILASCMVGVTTAHWFNERYDYQWTFWPMVFAAFGFFVVFKLIALTPLVGWLFTLLAVCTVFGAILLSIKWKRSTSALVQ
jgi:hypothetical protein